MNAKKLCTTIALLSMLSLTACGGEAEVELHGPISSAAQETAAAAPFPSAGVANDGKGEYLQSSIDESDPAWAFATDVLEPDVSPTLTEEQLTEAQHVFLKFATEEGIDSVFRRPHALKDQALLDAWVERNASKFIEGKVFELGVEDTDTISPMEAGYLDLEGALDPSVKTENAFTYDYGSDKMRMRERHIVMTKIAGPDVMSTQGSVADNMVAMTAVITYSMDARINGEPAVESGVTTAFANMELIDGEWKIKSFMTNDSSD